MREIKFRAWDKEFKKWSKMVLEYEIKDINYYTDYEWMQYTGIKDKNDIEIYEGDILHIEIKDKTIENKIIASSNEVVEYKDCKFGIVWGWHRDFIGLDGFCNATFEVIGNVYEDSKLLQEG
ncbi:YopX family protein [Clostridium botulinum]|uniref:YopX family protein n=1 Tax=Clostridium botulinum TaxID=1491 RepID=UPI000A177374|nr:YopX family protein [Clostridium botulinum]OSB09009.1 hypothetical protein B2H96_17635 [Clostridium botulinum]